MDALLPPLAAAFLAEWGDRTQLLAVLLAVRFRGSAQVLFAIAIAAIVNSLISAFAGALLADIITFRAITLMTALALAFAAGGAVFPQKTPKLDAKSGHHTFFVSFFSFATLEFGDKTQFLTAALAARSHSIWLAGLGAAVGVILANTPAVIWGERLKTALPLRALRTGAAILLAIAAAFAAINALRLI